MLEELSSMQDHWTVFLIRRHDKIIEDNEIHFKNMHQYLHFKFMDIIVGFKNNKVVYMNRYLEASDDGTVYLII